MSHKTYSTVEGEKGYCGDHYCSGHRSFIAQCECGEVFSKQKLDHKELEFLHLKHRVDEAGL
jgi:hypothetical protein